jgi:hypothetical protein
MQPAKVQRPLDKHHLRTLRGRQAHALSNPRASVCVCVTYHSRPAGPAKQTGSGEAQPGRVMHCPRWQVLLADTVSAATPHTLHLTGTGRSHHLTSAALDVSTTTAGRTHTCHHLRPTIIQSTHTAHPAAPPSLPQVTAGGYGNELAYRVEGTPPP